MPVADIQLLRCIRCQAIYSVEEMPIGCPACFERGQPTAVTPELDLRSLAETDLVSDWKRSSSSIWKFHQLLPVPLGGRVTLEEGGTPLLPMGRLRDDLRLGELWVKDERRNPTGSFKDRFFSVCMSRARQTGADVVTIASSGNGGASAAAYAAAAGLRCIVITTPDITTSWRAAISITGATIIATTTSAERWELLQIGVEELGWYPLTNYVTPPVGSNWYGIEGYKTIAYEIAASLGWHAPDWMVVPTSRGDGLYGIWRGFVELHTLGLVSSLPKMAAVERFPSLTTAIAEQLDWAPEVAIEPTVAVSIGSNTATYQALNAVRQSGGTAVTCADDDLLGMVRAAGEEGIFVEVSAAAGLCGVKRLVGSGLAGPDSTVVAVITATGLTDPSPIIVGQEPLNSVQPTVQALRDIMRRVAGRVRAD